MWGGGRVEAIMRDPCTPAKQHRENANRAKMLSLSWYVRDC